MDSVWHSAPDSRSVPPKDVGATVLSPMSKNKSSDPVGLLLNPCAVPGSMAGPFVSFGVPFGGSFGKGFLFGILGVVLWSFGIPLGTKRRPGGNQMGTNWDQVGTT